MSKTQRELTRLVKNITRRKNPDFKHAIKVILKSKLSMRKKLTIIKDIFGVRRKS